MAKRGYLHRLRVYNSGMAANPDLDLAALLLNWENVLKSEGKANATLLNYQTGVTLYIAWCKEQGETPRIDRRLVTEWVVALLASGSQATTARARQLAVRRFSAWLAGEEDIDYTDQLLGIKPPKLTEKLIKPLSERDVKLMIATCESATKLRDRRDEAVLRMMYETGLRAGEVVALTVADVDTASRVVAIQKSKTGRGRTVRLSPKAAVAMDKYLRVRRKHVLAHWPNLWLGESGMGLGYMGLRATLGVRAELAGIKGFHLHLMRHTAAGDQLDAGMSEQAVMAGFGWNSRSMLDRYTRAGANERAMAEAEALGIGNNL